MPYILTLLSIDRLSTPSVLNFYHIHNETNSGSPSEPIYVQMERVEDFLSVGVSTHAADSAPEINRSIYLSHVTGISSMSFSISSVEICQNDLAKEGEDIRDESFVAQSHFISTKPFHNSLCAQHNVEDSIGTLKTDSEPGIQVGVFKGVGIVQAVQAGHDEPSRGLRRVGQLPLRKLKMARERKKEKLLQRLKNIKDKAVCVLTPMSNKIVETDLTTQNQEEGTLEEQILDGLEDGLPWMSQREFDDAVNSELQGKQEKDTENELVNQAFGELSEGTEKADEPEKPDDQAETSIQLGLDRVVLQPVSFAVSRFTEEQRKIIETIDDMMEELQMVWLGPSAWSAKP